MSDLEDAIALNSEPLGLKRVIRRVQDNDPAVTVLDFGEYDQERFYTDVSCRLLAVFSQQ
eukprot:NODE_5299_length_416_cov_55.738420_g4620_i0.p1 GENE.NODE_5299_length_416_cov_55.738420_g4620_i0~~NODE_5299_length_416_cov_55.738420_g4620_i0.p1  ORF type:complete len:60 (+),score=8.74 NODE_5299_length_416_cov_55.738420_g4620_i0:136-315(+)